MRKSIGFCKQLGMPILGIVENMAGFVCPDCGSLHTIFKVGGGERTALTTDVPFLGRLPLDSAVASAGDEGRTIGSLDGRPKEEMDKIVDQVIDKTINKVKGNGEKMKIGIPLAGGKLCTHFGHCEQFAVVEVQNGQISGIEKLTPPPHEPGVIPAWLATQGATLVLAGGMGEKAQVIFKQKGIDVICGVTSGTPEEVVQSYLAGSLVTTVNPCSHDADDHHCGGNEK